MANTKISELTELAEIPAIDDVLPIVDTSTVTTKKITPANLTKKSGFYTVGPTGSGAERETDGTADEVQINAAITAANSAGGGIVQLLAGTYTCAAEVTMRSNVILQGIGEASIISFSGAGHEINIEGRTHWKIRNLKVDTTGKSSGSNLEHTIRIYNSQHYEIYGCHLECYAFGIFMGTSDSISPDQENKDGFIHHNYIHGPCRNDLIGGGKASATAQDTRNITVHDNYIVQDQTMSGFSTYYTAMDMVSVKGVSFSGNHVWGSVLFGSEQDPHIDSQITKNVVYPPLNSTTVPATIMIDDGVQTTNQSKNLDIEGNFLYGGWIRVRGTAAQRALKVRIRGNTVINDATLVTAWLGITQRGVSLTDVDEALITGNTLDANGASSTTAILLSGCSNCHTSGNIIKSYTTALEIGGTALNNDFGPNTFVSVTNRYGTALLAELGTTTARMASFVEQYREIDADANGGTVTVLMSGRVFTNEAATAEANFTLPSAVKGPSYTFICQDDSGLKITAATGDTIRLGSSVTAAAGNIATTTIGNAVKLTAINATEWIAEYSVGTWTVT